MSLMTLETPEPTEDIAEEIPPPMLEMIPPPVEEDGPSVGSEAGSEVMDEGGGVGSDEGGGVGSDEGGGVGSAEGGIVGSDEGGGGGLVTSLATLEMTLEASETISDTAEVTPEPIEDTADVTSPMRLVRIPPPRVLEDSGSRLVEVGGRTRVVSSALLLDEEAELDALEDGSGEGCGSGVGSGASDDDADDDEAEELLLLELDDDGSGVGPGVELGCSSSSLGFGSGSSGSFPSGWPGDVGRGRSGRPGMFDNCGRSKRDAGSKTNRKKHSFVALTENIADVESLPPP